MRLSNPISTTTVLTLAAVSAAGVIWPNPSFGQTVSDGALADMQVQRVGDCTNLMIVFNTRVQLLSHFPESSGRELHVRLKPLDSTTVALGRDSLRTPESLPELRSVSYEGDTPGGPVLSLFFTRDTEFTVEAGALPNSIVIRIAKPGTGARCRATSVSSATPSTQAATPESSAVPGPIPPGLYVINLSSAVATPALDDRDRSRLGNRVVYVTEFEKDSQTWHRLRVGFFATREEAEAARRQLQANYPEAWVVKVTPEERQQGVTTRLFGGDQPANAGGQSTTVGSEADAAETARLISEAEAALQAADVDRAIQLLTNASALPENANTPRALELLGLAREKKGQKAQARAQYQEYLRRYPTGEGADRVRQRLSALDSDGTVSAGTLRQAKGTGGGNWRWGVRGSFSQFYFRDQGRTSTLNTSSTLGNEVDNSVNVNQLLTSGDITISGGNDRRIFQIRAAGSYTQNFGTSASITTINNGTEVQTFRSKPGGGQGAISALYFDYTDNDFGTQLRIGRQTRNSQGVLGRFDGGLFSFQPSPRLRFNVVAGFPVLSSRQTYVLTERPFYGVSVDIGAKRSPLQFSVYWFDQHAQGGFVDRRSVGLEGRVLQKNFNAYAMVDYDVKFGELNLGLFTFNYNFTDGSNLGFTADYRRSPLLTTTNAMIGMQVAQLDANGLPIYTIDNSDPLNPRVVQDFQMVTSLQGLKPFFTDPQIYQLAMDRTLIAKSFTVTYSRPLTRKLQISADFTLTDTGGTPGTPARIYADSNGLLIVPLVPTVLWTQQVDALPATGKEYYYGMQLIGSDLVMGSDIYILSGRFADTSTAKIFTVDLNARLPVTSSFRISPRIRYGIRDNKPTATAPVPGNFRQLQPTIRFNYYPIRNSEIEVEVGANFSRQKSFNSTTSAFDQVNEKGWVLSAGYRLDF